ncbi:hypothetical protein E4T47_05061 [Aureobasidium subglaciale]|nr:hypothetical protein E4T47_05061 [Aureobasidium subglaciale]
MPTQEVRLLPFDPPLGPSNNQEISQQEMIEAESTVSGYLEDPTAFDAAHPGGRSTATAMINTLSFQQIDSAVNDNTSITQDYTHSTTRTPPNEDDITAEMGSFLAAYATATDEQVAPTNQPTSRLERRVSFVIPAATQPRPHRLRVFVFTVTGWIRLTRRQEAANARGRSQCLVPICRKHGGRGFISGFARRRHYERNHDHRWSQAFVGWRELSDLILSLYTC